ncbi:MAG: hypothetical protein WCI67_06265 [Chloroflexales bacterium]
MRQHLFVGPQQLRQIAEAQWAALGRAGSRGADGGRVCSDARPYARADHHPRP